MSDENLDEVEAKKLRLKIIQQIEGAFEQEKFVVLTGPSGVGKTNLSIEVLGEQAWKVANKRWQIKSDEFEVQRNGKLIIDEAQRLDKDDNHWTPFILKVLKHKVKLIIIAQNDSGIPYHLRRDIDSKKIKINTPLYFGSSD